MRIIHLSNYVLTAQKAEKKLLKPQVLKKIIKLYSSQALCTSTA